MASIVERDDKMDKRNQVCFKVYGMYALFTDPLTRVGGEKFTYPIPTAEALKGIMKSVYWKPSLVWVIDRCRVMKPIQTQTKGIRPIAYNSEKSDLSYYTYLYDVEYQVEAHFEWNTQRPELAEDHNENKHRSIAKRMIERGGRRDIFLGTRECQGYVEHCVFGEGKSYYNPGNLSFGLMFHGFDYPDECGGTELIARFDNITMHNGVIEFRRPEDCHLRKRAGKSYKLPFVPGVNMEGVDNFELD